MAIAIKALGRYVQGPGELKNLGKNTKKMGTHFFILCSGRGRERFGAIMEESIRAEGHEVSFGLFHGQATKAEVAAQIEACRAAGCDAVIGAGGGKVIDTAKAVADGLELPCIIVPTVASNDAPCTGVAVLYNEEGVVVKALITKRNPDLVLVDSEIISKTPLRFFRAGIADALATWIETRACVKTHARNMSRGEATLTGQALSKLCYDTLMADGVAAVQAVREQKVTPELEHVIEASILLSGMGFEGGGLAAAHAVNDGFAHEPQAKNALHGEKVSYGILVQLVLEHASAEEMAEVRGFMKETGLPTRLADLGIQEIVPETLRRVAEAATVPTQYTKNVSPDITAEDVYQAILAVDAM
ncbi:MAG: glycerol dehydrogenase [Ndongobacter sp.]|nr:glycerol dehydrogenase [Ndongobacter sp.]